MIADIYSEYKELGLQVIPIEWKDGEVAYHPKGWGEDVEVKLHAKHNGLMIRTAGKYGCLDFDLKNTDNKDIFVKWVEIITNTMPDILQKVFVEETRNKGYHVWLDYHGLPKKTQLAQGTTGQEVIAMYSNGPLVYTYPTPGYSEFYNSMADLQPLTDDEYQHLVSTSQYFNEYHPTYDPNTKAVSYPEGYEKLLLGFDTLLPDEVWQQILADIGLVVCHEQPRDKPFIAYRRKDSSSLAIGAKVYNKGKRLLLFTASMPDFPNWHTKDEYPIWSLPPSFVLFYKYNRDWPATIEVINQIIDSADIDIYREFDVRQHSGYPVHVFPLSIQKSIREVCEARSLSIDFVCTSALWTISSMAGTRYHSDFNGDAKNILYCLLVAPVSVGKTPAFRVTCESPLQKCYAESDKQFELMTADWNEKKAAALADKKQFTEKKPRRFIPIAVDGTTEGYISKSMQQRLGLGVYQDEAETIFNAGSFKSNNDSISFFTQAFGGGRITQIRADEDKERVVPNLNINLLMGTQPSRLKNIFTEDRLASGFPSRFLIVQAPYKLLNEEVDPFADSKQMCQDWIDKLTYLYNEGMKFNSGSENDCKIHMSDAAKALYRAYYRAILQEANTRIKNKVEGFIIGTEAKMSAYLPRLIQVLAIMHNPVAPIIDEEIVKHGWDLYRFYSASTVKCICDLYGEIETGLPKELDLLYQGLPETFDAKTAAETCIRLNLKERRFETAYRRKDFAALFVKREHGIYTKK